MQAGSLCDWYLLKIGDDDYAVQYTGSNPDLKFPKILTGFSPSFKLTIRRRTHEYSRDIREET
jgi:hypothetical protein